MAIGASSFFLAVGRFARAAGRFVGPIFTAPFMNGAAATGPPRGSRVLNGVFSFEVVFFMIQGDLPGGARAIPIW